MTEGIFLWSSLSFSTSKWDPNVVVGIIREFHFFLMVIIVHSIWESPNSGDLLHFPILFLHWIFPNLMRWPGVARIHIYPWRIHSAAIYGNMYHPYTPNVSINIPAPWILWDMCYGQVSWIGLTWRTVSQIQWLDACRFIMIWITPFWLDSQSGMDVYRSYTLW